MTINERVKMIRKSERLNEKEKMTMERFGARLGVGKTAISDIENGRNGLSNQLFTAICREFSVNPDWLRDGSGKMFRERSRNDVITDFINDVLVNEPDGIRARMISALSRLDDEEWDRIAQIAGDLVDEQNREKAARSDDQERQALHAELDRQLDEEKEAAEGSGASSAS